MKDLKGNITTRTDSVNKWVTLRLLSVAAVSTCFGGGAIIMKYTNIHCTTCIQIRTTSHLSISELGPTNKRMLLACCLYTLFVRTYIRMCTALYNTLTIRTG